MHDETLKISIEQHERAATVYVSGVLRIASALRLVRVCEQLPTAIDTARLDLRAVYHAEEDALTVLASHLRHWRRRRGGIRIVHPAASALPDQPPPRSSSK